MSEKFQKTKWFWKNNYFLVLSLMPMLIIMVALEAESAGRTNIIPNVFGDQKTSMFDLWSIQHFLSGVLIGSLLITPKYATTKKWKKMAPITLFIAFGWEAFELFVESGGVSYVKEFWNNREHWSNRLVTDPILVFLGGIVGYLSHDSWKIAIVPVIIWLAIKTMLM